MGINWMAVIAILSCIMLFFVIVMIIDGNRFHVVRYELKADKITREHTFVLLSDLHNKTYGKDHCRLIKKIKEQDPEGILIAGDMLTARPGYPLEPSLSLMTSLAKECPIYYGMGNHEARLFFQPEVYGSMGEDYREGLEKAGVSLMDNETVLLEDHLAVTGLNMAGRYFKKWKKATMDPDYLSETLEKKQKDKYQILLAHNPDYFEEYAAWGADLILSGHIHGGVMRLPFIGGVVSPSCIFFPKYDGGLIKRFGTSMIVSRGLGMHSIPIRIFNPGELVVLHLKPIAKEEKSR